MNKKELKKIYKTLSKLKKQDDELEKAIINFLKTSCQDTNHYYINEKGMFNGAMEILSVTYDKSFIDDIEYWFYECDCGKNNLSGTIKDKKYTFNTLSNYLDFVISYNKLDYVVSYNK